MKCVMRRTQEEKVPIFPICILNLILEARDVGKLSSSPV